ncbi:MAG: thymidine phosphorylase [Desulfobacula sp.]|nr:thymidine phosphorylase [Desulfobacula sp.]
MHFLDLILKKRDGKSLSRKEIEFFVSGYVKGDIPDYQVSSMLMAIWFSKMDEKETAYLTFAMKNSGDVIDLSRIKGIKADKHSTGGVADTATLITAPLVAACGLKIAKMSGRGLGHTGGTIDKLESIPGFSTDIDIKQFEKIVQEGGLSIIGQTNKLVPADKMLYALRDVTGTVDNISLIAASIMSKKLASGSDVIVLDVKTGNGAFMQHIEDARALAASMVSIGKIAKKRISAIITDMNQPLGNAVGNALEVREAIEILQGNLQGDLKDVSLALAAKILVAGGVFKDNASAMDELNQVLSSGRALKKLEQMIIAQGGDPRVCHDTKLLPGADQIISIKAKRKGYIKQIVTSQIGFSALLLGAGRVKKSDSIDPGVGIWMKKRLGDFVDKNDIVAQFYVNDTKNLEQAVERFENALVIQESPSDKKTRLIYDSID